MSNNNIFDDNYRKNFLKTADTKSLNDYLKNMDRLSKKGGKYLEMYNKDLDFLLGLNDKYYQNAGDILNIFTTNSPNGTRRALSEQQPVCDTEGYVNRINNITKNSFCSLVTQQTNKCDNRCENRFNELDLIKVTLENKLAQKSTNNDWIKSIQKFIDIVFCCGNTYSKEEYEPFRTIYFKKIIKIIANNQNFTKEAFIYLNKILHGEKEKLSTEFMKKYTEFRIKKNKISKEQYKSEKEQLIKDYIIKLGSNGFQIVYSSKLVEKIIHSYKKYTAAK